MSQIPLYLVTGFLGSGKTTFLKRILNTYGSDLKIAVVQNEFAPANIDGAVLKKETENFKLLEINNGSVFCVCLLGRFTSSLRAFVDEHQPDMIFLEASGLSDPIAIAQLLDLKELKGAVFLAKIWTVVDGLNFLKQHKLVTRLQHQVRIADSVIINKTDLISEEQIKEVEIAIRALNPFTEIFYASYCDIPSDQLDLKPPEETIAEMTRDQHAQFESCGKPEIGAGVFRSARIVPQNKLMQLIDIYAHKTIRIKGFVKLADNKGLAVQTSFDQKEFIEIENYQGSTELIAMGEGFNLSEFSRNYREIAK